MPRLSAKVVTTAEVTLRPKLIEQLKAKLTEYHNLTAQAKRIKAKISGGTDEEGNAIPGLKAELETLFADADEYAALEAGVRVDTPFGTVPMKIVKGQTARKLNITKVLKKFKITLKALESCYDPPKDKAPYLGIWLPGDKEDE